MDDILGQLLISLLLFGAVFLLVWSGWTTAVRLLRRQCDWYERVLVHQLMMDVDPRVAVGLSIAAVVITGGMAYLIAGGPVFTLLGAGLGALIPNLVIKHLEQKRRERLETQLVDGIMTMASGVRAGLNLVQSFELLVKNSLGPIRQEFTQLLREYQMGLDLNQAMRNTANRIGSGNYRLLFTAMEMHRQRGGNAGETLDRIAESIREIQRLEGKLDALTAQGRIQAWMMAAMPVVFLAVLYTIDPQGVTMLFVEPVGRIMLMIVVALIAVGFVWIRRIMAVDI